MKEQISQLNPQQQEAVRHGDEPLLLLAGAGSGKTRTLTQRVAWLINERGVAPWQILAVTFTNKAASEMRQRLEQLLGDVRGLWISTFHATCVRILRREAERLGFTGAFTIYDANDQERLLRDVIKELGLPEKSIKPRAAASFIDSAKNRGQFPDDVEDNFQNETAIAVYALYQKRLRAANALDFGDLLLYAVHLFEQHPDILARYRDQFRYLMVDEFQDTNSVQYRLVQMLAADGRGLCVVGDDDQSIYAWRGAEIGNILNFERDFAGARVIRLEQNYRSTQTILSAAGELVAQNVGRKGKELWTEKPAGDKIVLEALPDDLEEARYVVGEVARLRDEGRHLRDIAVFYRTNAQSRSFEEALVRERIPYVMVGGVKFFSRMEIKDILAYLRTLVNPADTVSARRIVNVPARGIGATTIGRIAAFEEEAGGFYPACSKALETGALKGTAEKKVHNFVDLMRSFEKRLERLPYPQLTSEIIEETGYGPALREDGTRESTERMQNLEELLKGMEEHRGTEGSLQDYLEQVALVTDLDSYDTSLDRVTLMTLHAAKGLEFPVVFMTGMEEGLFPHSRATDGGEDLEEERRLCYVGMTRAMEKLYLTHARRRRVFGSYQFNPPSRFLGEIPDHYFEARAPAAMHQTSEHNLASVFDAAPAEQDDDTEPEFDEEPFEEEPRYVPEAEEGVRIGMRVRHVKFGVGTIRRIDGSGDNQKVTIYFNRFGPKKLLLKFAGLEPA
ncbi:MAG: UvrD-helicase domain-containing protein [Desulfuromonadales bacterium]